MPHRGYLFVQKTKNCLLYAPFRGYLFVEELFGYNMPHRGYLFLEELFGYILPHLEDTYLYKKGRIGFYMPHFGGYLFVEENIWIYNAPSGATYL